jgi:hypothetical protein
MVKIKAKPYKSKKIKTPEIPPVSYDNVPPHFSFEYLDDQYGLSGCNKDERSCLLDKLRILGTTPWAELITTARHKHGTETIPKGQINGKLPKIITDDVQKVLAFRFQGMKPMVGHRIDRTFYIIWIDSKFKLYDHGD